MMDGSETGGPARRTVLVVEDDYFIAQDLVAMLQTIGVEVIGPAPNLAQARLICDAADGVEAAILDVNLGGEMVWPLVDLLRARGVPVVLATGYSDVAIPERYADLPRCGKPTGLHDLARHLNL